MNCLSFSFFNGIKIKENIFMILKIEKHSLLTTSCFLLLKALRKPSCVKGLNNESLLFIGHVSILPCTNIRRDRTLWWIIKKYLFKMHLSMWIPWRGRQTKVGILTETEGWFSFLICYPVIINASFQNEQILVTHIFFWCIQSMQHLQVSPQVFFLQFCYIFHTGI